MSNAENRLVSVVAPVTATLGYDGQGNRVVREMGGETRLYLDDYFESDTGYTTWVRYYYFGGQRVAQRTSLGVTYLHGDHLGSMSKTTGYTTTEQLYFPYGSQRTAAQVAAEYRYTSQRWEEAIGLYDYKARWYDPELGRFLQPDSIVPEPGNPQALNRYGYVRNNPVRFIDPSGHDALGDAWREEFRAKHGVQEISNLDELIRLFSLAYPEEWFGYGLWNVFHENGGKGMVIGSAVERWFQSPPASRSWDTMAAALLNLSKAYTKNEKAAYVRDVAFLYARTPGRSQSESHGMRPYWSIGQLGGNHGVWVQAGSIDSAFITSTTQASDADMNVHHWAWAFSVGYDIGDLGYALNRYHELRNDLRVDDSDIKMGNRGVSMGLIFAQDVSAYSDMSLLFQRYLGVGE